MKANVVLLVSVLVALVSGTVIGIGAGAALTPEGRTFVVANVVLLAAGLVMFIFWDRWQHE